MLLAASPVRAQSVCDGLKKYVTGKAATPFMANRVRGADSWRARTPISTGDCNVTFQEKPHQYALTCVFNSGAKEQDLLANYQALGADIQTCLDGLDSRFDWRKRNTSRTEADGRTVKETTWIWTMLRDQTERQVRVSSNSGGAGPPDDALIVLWRTLKDD